MSRIKNKSAISCAMLDIEPTRTPFQGREKVVEEIKKIVYDGICTHADFTEKITARMLVTDSPEKLVNILLSSNWFFLFIIKGPDLM